MENEQAESTNGAISTTGELGLAAENTRLQNEITRMRGTQSANDRAAAELRANVASLNSQLKGLQEQLEAANAKAAQVATYEATTKSLQEQLAALTSERDAHAAKSAQMAVVAEYAGKFPQVSVLAANGVLPQYEGNPETYKGKIEALVTQLFGQPAALQSKPTPPAAQPTPSSARMDEILEMVNKGDKRGIELYTQLLKEK